MVCYTVLDGQHTHNLRASERSPSQVCRFSEERGAHSGSDPVVRGRPAGNGKAVRRADGRRDSDGHQRGALIVACAPEALLEDVARC